MMPKDFDVSGTIQILSKMRGTNVPCSTREIFSPVAPNHYVLLSTQYSVKKASKKESTKKKHVGAVKRLPFRSVKQRRKDN